MFEATFPLLEISKDNLQGHEVVDEEKDRVATILLVDDIPSIRTLFRRLLEQRGFQVVEAENGCQAVELYCDNAIDLVITDLDMPEMRGDELIYRLSPPRFLVVSADPKGIPPHWPRLIKPVSGAELLEMVRRCLG